MPSCLTSFKQLGIEWMPVTSTSMEVTETPKFTIWMGEWPLAIKCMRDVWELCSHAIVTLITLVHFFRLSFKSSPVTQPFSLSDDIFRKQENLIMVVEIFQFKHHYYYNRALWQLGEHPAPCDPKMDKHVSLSPSFWQKYRKIIAFSCRPTNVLAQLIFLFGNSLQ